MTSTFSIDLLRRRLLPTDTDLKSKETHLPHAAVAVIIDSSQTGSSLLLIRRTERSDDPWSGQIAFPGGHKAPSDRSFLETAIREANEEVGISLKKHVVLGVLPLVYARGRRVRVAPFVFQLMTSVEIRSNMEVADVFWVPVNELANSAVTKSQVRVEGGELTVSSYIYRRIVIWGLTFRIINLLLGTEKS
ncbi:MAG: CoA pyrophosphatase [Candidatus Bathyarchaeia archaeon]